MVMDHLLEHDDANSSSLKSASLVCRSFVAPCQCRIFATVRLRFSPDKPDRFTLRTFIPTNSKRGFKSSIEAFSRVTTDSPHLLGYVRHLDLHGSPYPLQPALSSDHRDNDCLNSQSHLLMTFLPNLAPTLRGFGMYRVNWNNLLPDLMITIKSIFKSNLLTSLTLEWTTFLPIPVLTSCAHLQHFNLETIELTPPDTWHDSAALARPVPNHQKQQLISLTLSTESLVIDWFATKHCIFDISRLRHLVVFGAQRDFTKLFQICSSTLASLEMPGQSDPLIYSLHALFTLS